MPALRASCSAVAAAVLALASGAALSGEGEAQYLKECSKCHGRAHTASAPPKLRPGAPRAVRAGFRGPTERLAFALPYGPPLGDVVGRPAASVPGFDYSRAFRKALEGAVWTEAAIDAFITDSQAMAPGSRMFYQQPDANVRRAIVGYLAQGRD